MLAEIKAQKSTVEKTCFPRWILVCAAMVVYDIIRRTALPGVVTVGIGKDTNGNPAIVTSLDQARPITQFQAPIHQLVELVKRKIAEVHYDRKND
ncbi:hypothetical protein [Kaarinaea lacus]